MRSRIETTLPSVWNMMRGVYTQSANNHTKIFATTDSKGKSWCVTHGGQVRLFAYYPRGCPSPSTTSVAPFKRM